MAGKPQGGKRASAAYEATRVYLRDDLKYQAEQRKLDARREHRPALDLSDQINEAVEQYLTMRRLPVVGTVSAGSLALAVETADEWISVPAALAKDARFALRVRGDSMAPALRDGELVIVREQVSAEIGQVAVVLVGDEACVKRVKRPDGEIVFCSDNPEYPDLDAGQARVIGRVIGAWKEM
jgi:SOS-response transcriptional repressor LexA